MRVKYSPILLTLLYFACLPHVLAASDEAALPEEVPTVASATPAPVPAESKRITDVEEDIQRRFVLLFLSDTPLHYDDAHSFLVWLRSEVRLSDADKTTVCGLLRKFLIRTTARQVAPGQNSTGLAPPEAILRADAVDLLGRFGGKPDAVFLRDLSGLASESLPAAMQYPNWKATCEEALADIQKKTCTDSVAHPAPNQPNKAEH